MSHSKSVALLVFMAVVVASTAGAKSASHKKTAHTGKVLPEFSLKDPRGKVFTRKDILGDGAVFVVTAPILSDKSDQEDWAKYLKATKHKGKGRLVFLEDMSPSSFKGTARTEMKKQSDAGEEPLLLIDPEGELRKKLGVERKETTVFAFDGKGKLVHEERGRPSEGGASRIWKSLE
jgi:hypothetical protein